MSWAASNFTWGWLSGALFVDGAFMIGLGISILVGCLFIGLSLAALFMARTATRPLFSKE